MQKMRCANSLSKQPQRNIKTVNFKSFFSQQARRPSGIFGRWVMAQIFNRGNASLNDLMQEMLSLQENEHVLEIGFGTGKLIHEMAATLNTGKIEGIDLSAEMMALAVKKNKTFIDAGKVVLHQGDFERIDFKNDLFHKIYSVNTIYFWPDPNAWMVTFGDLIMLLLTFFVLLLTMKSMDSGALKDRFKDFAETTGPLEYSEMRAGGSLIEGAHVYKRSIVVSNNKTLEEVFDLLEGIERNRAELYELDKLRQVDQQAWIEGTRLLYVPTFFGSGRVSQ